MDKQNQAVDKGLWSGCWQHLITFALETMDLSLGGIFASIRLVVYVYRRVQKWIRLQLWEEMGRKIKLTVLITQLFKAFGGCSGRY